MIEQIIEQMYDNKNIKVNGIQHKKFDNGQELYNIILTDNTYKKDYRQLEIDFPDYNPKRKLYEFNM